MFEFIKKQLQKVYNTITSKLSVLFKQETVDEKTLLELEKILLESDTGVKTTNLLINNIRKKVNSGDLKHGHDLKNYLEEELIKLLNIQKYSHDLDNTDIILLVGINGSGKTTFAGKLGYFFKSQNQTVLFGAADTFRAAAVQQLVIWAELSNLPVVIGKENQDPASVVYTACQKFNNENFDKLIIDTAGRLQTKINLMKELEKIKKTIEKVLPNKKIKTLLTIDSMLGQNSLIQAKVFYEATRVDGIILTKMDGTGKGGIIFAITQELKIPVAYISYGEKIDQLKLFEPEKYIKELLQ